MGPMIRPVLLASLLCSGCFLFDTRNPQLEIVSPVGGTRITDHEPIQIFVSARDVYLDQLVLTVDGVPVQNIVASPATNGQYCDGCQVRVTWAGFEAKEGLHVIGIEALEDGELAASNVVDMVFEDTPEIARISPAADQDLAGYGM